MREGEGRRRVRCDVGERTEGRREKASEKGEGEEGMFYIVYWV